MKRKWTWLLLLGLALVVLTCAMPALADDYQYTPDTCPAHEYGAPVYSTEPNCTEGGVATRTCTKCGDVNRYAVSALGHEWGNANAIVAATCTQDGTAARVCTRCGISDTFAVTALGHLWSEWTVTQQANCTDEGAQSRICTRCNEAENQVLPALGHDYTSSTVVRQPTCSKAGLRRATCTRCGREVESEIPTTDHTFGDWITVSWPTDFAAGVSQRTCSVCSAVEQQPVYPKGTLRVGDSGDAVRELQQTLNNLGYDCGTADGIFGGKTMTAVANFERASSLTADGIAWPGVINMLNSGAPVPAAGTDGAADGADIVRTGTAALDVAFNPYKSDTITPDDNPVFVLKVTNTGEQTLAITDYMPADGEGIGTGGVETWEEVTGSVDGTVDVSRLQPGQSYFVRYMAHLTGSDQQGDTFERTFAVQAVAGDGSPVTGQASIALTIANATDEAAVAHVTLTAGDAPAAPATPGQWVTVPLTLTSDGDQSADIICSQLLVDDEWTASPLYITGGDSVTDLAPNGSLTNTLHIFITPRDGANGSVTRTVRYAYATHGGTDVLVTDEITVAVPTAPGDAPGESMNLTLQAGEIADAQAAVGDEVTVPLTLINEGTGTFVPAFANGLEPGDSVDEPTWLLLPGESMQITLNIAITQQDASAGSAERTLSMSGYHLIAPSANGTAVIIESNDQGEPTAFVSNEITITIPVAAFDGQPELSLSMSPADPSKTSFSVGDSVSLHWTLTNTGSADADFGGIARLYTDAQGENANATIFRGVSGQETMLSGGGSISGTDSFIISESEIIDDNTLYLRFFAQGCVVGTAQVCTLSNDVFVQIPLNGEPMQITQPTEPQSDAAIVLHKVEVSAPANGAYYTPDEEIAYELTLQNGSGDTISGITISDALSSAPLAAFDALIPGGAVNVSFSHTVTPLDAAIGHVTNAATASFTQNGMETAVMSNAVISPASDGAQAPALMVGMGETSAPASGQHYAQDEAITYAIYVTNIGPEPLANVTVYHTLGGVAGSKLDAFPLLAPMETRIITCQHTVSADDVTFGSVVNYAIATASPDGAYVISVHSSPVVSLTGQDGALEPQPGIAIIGTALNTQDNPCAVTLTARGNGLVDVSVHTCQRHSETDAQATALTSAAVSADAQLAAWSMARAMWQGEVDALYDQLFAAAMGESQLTVLHERITFLAWLNAYEADLNASLPDSPQEVTRLIALTLREKCIAMCHEQSTASHIPANSLNSAYDALPDSRHDADCTVTNAAADNGDTAYSLSMCASHTGIDTAMLAAVAGADSDEARANAFDAAANLWLANLDAQANARWSDADPAAQTAIAASRTAFAAWLVQREALLNDLYNSADVVNEQIMNAIAALAMRH